MAPPKDPIKYELWRKRNSEAKKRTWQDPSYLALVIKPKTKIICPICGVIFEDTPAHAKERVCCSNDCKNKRFRQTRIGEGNSFFGKRHKQSVKDTVSKANTNRPQSIATRKQRSESNKLVIHTLEWRENQSKALKGREITWADKLSAAKQGISIEEWEGFVTPLHQQIRGSSKYLNWRTAVFERDDYCDVYSGVKGNGNLNAHHIIPFSELLKQYNIQTLEDALNCESLWDINNGVTMIDTNHAAYHSMR